MAAAKLDLMLESGVSTNSSSTKLTVSDAGESSANDVAAGAGARRGDISL